MAKKYQYAICHFNNVEFVEEMDKLQDEGWEVCGNISVDPNPRWCMDKSIKVPVKRALVDGEYAIVPGHKQFKKEELP